MALFILYSGIGLIKETVDPLLGEAPSEELTQYIARKVLSYEGVLGTHDLMVHDYGPGRCFASVHVEMAAEKDVLESHDIIDNIERDFHDNDNIHPVIHYDPIQTGDRAVGTLRTWMEGQLQTISPQLSMHDFRTVRGPTHTNLIFDVVVPAGFSLGDEALRARIQQLAQQKNTEEMKYYTVVTVDHSYAPYPRRCRTDGRNEPPAFCSQNKREACAMEYELSRNMRGMKPSIIREILKQMSDPSLISFAGGNPAPDSFPTEDIARRVGELLRRTRRPCCSIR